MIGICSATNFSRTPLDTFSSYPAEYFAVFFDINNRLYHNDMTKLRKKVAVLASLVLSCSPLPSPSRPKTGKAFHRRDRSKKIRTVGTTVGKVRSTRNYSCARVSLAFLHSYIHTLSIYVAKQIGGKMPSPPHTFLITSTSNQSSTWSGNREFVAQVPRIARLLVPKIQRFDQDLER